MSQRGTDMLIPSRSWNNRNKLKGNIRRRRRRNNDYRCDGGNGKRFKTIVSFCMSAITMDQIMKKFSAKFSSGKRAGSPTKETERKENLMSTLSQSELTVTAVLDDTVLTLRDVLNLQVNDIIPLNKPITDNVQLKVGSTCWFDGKLGTLNGKKAFRIDNILKN